MASPSRPGKRAHAKRQHRKWLTWLTAFRSRERAWNRRECNAKRLEQVVPVEKVPSNGHLERWRLGGDGKFAARCRGTLLSAILDKCPSCRRSRGRARLPGPNFHGACGYPAVRMANINSPGVRSKSSPLRNGTHRLSNCSRYSWYRCWLQTIVRSCKYRRIYPSSPPRASAASRFLSGPLLSLTFTYYQRISLLLPQPPANGIGNGNNLLGLSISLPTFLKPVQRVPPSSRLESGRGLGIYWSPRNLRFRFPLSRTLTICCTSTSLTRADNTGPKMDIANLNSNVNITA